jgi:hypothetical protein
MSLAEDLVPLIQNWKGSINFVDGENYRHYMAAQDPLKALIESQKKLKNGDKIFSMIDVLDYFITAHKERSELKLLQSTLIVFVSKGKLWSPLGEAFCDPLGIPEKYAKLNLVTLYVCDAFTRRDRFGDEKPVCWSSDTGPKSHAQCQTDDLLLQYMVALRKPTQGDAKTYVWSTNKKAYSGQNLGAKDSEWASDGMKDIAPFAVYANATFEAPLHPVYVVTSDEIANMFEYCRDENRQFWEGPKSFVDLRMDRSNKFQKILDDTYNRKKAYDIDENITNDLPRKISKLKQMGMTIQEVLRAALTDVVDAPPQVQTKPIMLSVETPENDSGARGSSGLEKDRSRDQGGVLKTISGTSRQSAASSRPSPSAGNSAEGQSLPSKSTNQMPIYHPTLVSLELLEWHSLLAERPFDAALAAMDVSAQALSELNRQMRTPVTESGLRDMRQFLKELQIFSKILTAEENTSSYGTRGKAAQSRLNDLIAQSSPTLKNLRKKVLKRLEKGSDGLHLEKDRIQKAANEAMQHAEETLLQEDKHPRAVASATYHHFLAGRENPEARTRSSRWVSRLSA